MSSADFRLSDGSQKEVSNTKTNDDGNKYVHVEAHCSQHKKIARKPVDHVEKTLQDVKVKSEKYKR